MAANKILIANFSSLYISGIYYLFLIFIIDNIKFKIVIGILTGEPFWEPILFIIYINDFVFGYLIHSIYADDICIL